MPIQSQTNADINRAPARIASLYSVFGLLWIWISDRSLVWLGHTDDHGFMLAAGKGTLFIGITAVLLYWLVRREMAAVRTSKWLLRAVVEGTSDAVFVKDRDSRYMMANEAAARFIGRSVAEVIGRDDRELFEPADAERIISYDQAVMAGGKVATNELTLTSIGGTRTYHSTKAPYRDETGAVVGVIGISRDVSDRKAAVDALRLSEERFRELIDAIPQIVWTAGPDGTMTYVNAKAVEYTGMVVRDLAGWLWESVIHSDDLPRVVHEWRQCLADGLSRSVEMRMRAADGEYRWYIARNRPVRGINGEIASWVGTCTDIDDLKHAENALRETEASLRQAQRIAHLGSWSWEPPTDRVWWSDALFELFGVDRKAVSPSFDAFLKLLHPEERAVVFARVEAMKAGADEFANDLRVIRPDGSHIWIHSRARATRDADGALIRVEGTDQDITAHRKAEMSAREAEERLQSAVEVAGLGVIVIDYAQQTANLSPQAAEQFGFPAACTVSRNELHSRFHSEDRAEIERLTENALSLAGTGSFSMEHRVVRPDGSVRWLNVRKQVTFVDGCPNRAVVVSVDVTDRRHAVEALQSSEARYRLLFESNPHPMWVYDVDSLRVLAVNDAAVLEYGYHRDEFLGMTVRDLRPPEEIPRLEAFIAQLAPGRSHSTPWLHRRKDGTVFNVDISSHDLPEDGGRSRLVLALDITERLRAEESRDELLARLQLQIDRMPLAYIQFDSDIRYCNWNPAAEKIFGYSREEIIGQSVHFLVHPDDQGRIDAIGSRLRSGDVAAQSINRNVTKDGRTIICEWHNTPLFAPDGKFLGVLSMTQDITDRVQAEESRDELLARLQLQIDRMPLAYIQFDSDFRYSNWNPAAEKIFGYSREEIIGQTAHFLVHPDDQPQVDTIVSRLRSGDVAAQSINRNITKDGRTIICEWHNTPLFTPDGKFLGVLSMTQDITDRVRAEEALRESERRLRLSLESAGAIAFIWDVKSDSVTRFFSKEPALPITAEHLGTLNEVRARVHSDDLASFDSRLSTYMAEGTEYRNEYRIVRPDGTAASLEEYGYVDRAADGTARCLTGIAIDVTDRVAATDALRASEMRYRKLVDLLPTAIFVYADNGILYGNPAFVRMMGVSGENELLGISPFDISHPSAHDAIRLRHEEMLRTSEATAGFEMKLVRRDGRSVPVYSVAAPISGYGQSATVVVLSDLTEREHANELLRTVLGSVNDAIITIDESGVVGSANPAAVRQFGYSEEEIVGQNIKLLMPQPHRDEHEGYLANYLRTGIAKVIGIGREVEGRRRDGTLFPAELTVTEFRLDEQRHFTGVLRDITARKRLESQFQQAQKMEAVGRLAGGVAHDFNNLLTVINGYCELLMTSDLPVGDQRREKVATILNAGEQAARLTQQLLAFSRKAIVEPKELDLNELVSESAKLIRRLIGEDIILAVISAATPVWVKADPSQLEQVIMNLVVNARDAMPTGGRLTIQTSIVSGTMGDATRFAQLSVTDTGHGMSDDVKGKIFEPFFTTKDVGKGTGLGLAVVHGVVTQCGGQITVESAVGVGTTFHLMFPLVTVQAPDVAAETMRLATRGTETVLLVEDEKAVRKIARMSLQAHGYTVLEADGAAEAIRLAETHPGEIHLLVSDVVMPEMGGRLLLDAVRKIRPELRVLFMSGYTDDAVLLHGVVESTDAFIQKPFTPLGLARKVREVINAPAN